jgi:hypothetical protein
MYTKLILKYIGIVNKIGNIGIIKFYNYCVENNCKDFINEMIRYCDIIKNFKNNFKNKFLMEVYNFRIEQIKQFQNMLYFYQQNNISFSKDMIINLF